MSSLQFGIVIPYGSARQAAELAHLAEESGWDGVFLGDAVWTEDPLIRLTAAAMTTTRLKLGTMVIPAPLRQPWTLAGQCLALDHLSQGRLILGLATGATWMGWNWFPSLPLDIQTRAEMLDETIDILTQMFERKQFDYPGKHFPVQLSRSDPQHFPPASYQQPRVPIWVPGVWGKKKSMQRVLKCDGFFPALMDAEGKFVDVTPEKLTEMTAWIQANRPAGQPFETVVEGKSGELSPEQAREKMDAWANAGATWWVESTWGMEAEAVAQRIRQGPPKA
jgi:alkanesulfonate monooxygenase SsuD/methylene tetrahydromethanopterin reductase-like flavin-dependent oxidoreductase (luciferase family)